jgi:hypothetical protein
MRNNAATFFDIDDHFSARQTLSETGIIPV